MEQSAATQNSHPPLSCNPVLTLGGKVKPRTTLALVGAAAVGSGLAFGWDSLAALGLTSVIVSLLPCVLMCAAAICLSRIGRRD